MYSDIQEFSSNAAPGRPEQDEEGPVETGPVPSGELGTGTGEGDRTNKSGPDVDAASLETDAQQPSEDSAAAPEVLASSLGIQMLGLAGEAIAGLAVRVAVDGEVQDLLTDEEGALPQIRALAGMKLEISVQRFDGSFKLIDSGLMPSGNSQWGFVSPKSVFDIETTAHEGEAGEAEQSVPTPLPADKGLEPDTAHEEAAHALPMPGEPQKTASIEPAQGVSAKAVAPASTRPSAPAQPLIRPRPAALAAPAAPAASRPPPSSAAVCQAQPPRQVIPPKISGKGAPPAPALPRKSGRDAEGKPLLVIAVQKVTDWWNSWRLPTSGIFGSRSGARPIYAAVKRPVNGLSALAGCAPSGAAAFDASMPGKVAALLEFAEEQTQYAYGSGTADVLASMARGTFAHKKGEKESTESKGKCYQYVRVALSRCQIVAAGFVADRASPEVQKSASKAGPGLLEKGFVDVTDEVPDGRWAAAGDVIVYAWSDETWADRKARSKDANYPNHGHIDIRSHETYISDFLPQRHAWPKWIVSDKNGPSGYRSNYVNVRIYRKIFDPLPTCHIRAFLSCLREYECQQYKKDEDRYRALHTRLPEAEGGGLMFQSFDTHPWLDVPKNAKGGSTAAGAYQIVLDTWAEKFNRGYFPDLEGKQKFSPVVQDRVAVLIMELADALPHVRSGRIDAAVSMLRGIWVSLPGGSQNAGRLAAGKRPMDMSYFKEIFLAYFEEEKKKCGLG